ncbi:hypothetical protein Tco_0639088 [Tanacetum coccineum]
MFVSLGSGEVVTDLSLEESGNLKELGAEAFRVSEDWMDGSLSLRVKGMKTTHDPVLGFCWLGDGKNVFGNMGKEFLGYSTCAIWKDFGLQLNDSTQRVLWACPGENLQFLESFKGVPEILLHDVPCGLLWLAPSQSKHNPPELSWLRFHALREQILESRMCNVLEHGLVLACLVYRWMCLGLTLPPRWPKRQNLTCIVHDFKGQVLIVELEFEPGGTGDDFRKILNNRAGRNRQDREENLIPLRSWDEANFANDITFAPYQPQSGLRNFWPGLWPALTINWTFPKILHKIVFFTPLEILSKLGKAKGERSPKYQEIIHEDSLVFSIISWKDCNPYTFDRARCFALPNKHDRYDRQMHRKGRWEDLQMKILIFSGTLISQTGDKERFGSLLITLNNSSRKSLPLKGVKDGERESIIRSEGEVGLPLSEISSTS